MELARLSKKGFNHETPPPPLPRHIADRFSLDRFMAAGGQAKVWIGTDLRHTRTKVIFRFPKALCDDEWCRVEELDASTRDELWRSCELANIAVERHYTRLADEIDDDRKFLNQSNLSIRLQQSFSTPRTTFEPFSRCMVPLSTKGSELAFEIWTHAGDVTLGEGFFLGRTVGKLEIEHKRQVFEDLWDATRTLADRNIGRDRRCCCTRKSGSRICMTVALEPPTPTTMISRWMKKLQTPSLCPTDYEEVIDACGPIVHHDIKFDNVVLKGSKNKIIPEARIIDFGAASRCYTGYSQSYSRNWIPYWLQDSPETFSTGECWSYDTFGLGLAWLTTELLKELHPSKLLCGAAVRVGLVERSSMVSNRSHSTCPDFRLDWYVTQIALEPVKELVSDLRWQLLKPAHLASSGDFKASLKEFISNRSSEKDALHLILPDDDFLIDRLFSMLHECPAYPSNARWPRYQEDARSDQEDLLRCRFRKASYDLHDAMSQGNKNVVTDHVKVMNDICQALALHLKGYMNDGEVADLRRLCEADNKVALWSQVRLGDADSMKKIFTDLVKQGYAAQELASLMGDDGESMLATAARARSVPMVKFLLDNGADPIQELAVSPSSPPLVENNSSDNLTVSSDSSSMLRLTPLLVAASLPNNKDVLNLLFKALPGQLQLSNLYSSGDVARIGPSLLSLVAENGDVAMLGLVVDALRPHLLADVLNGDAIVPTTRKRYAPLLRAARQGQALSCAFLLDINAEVATVDLLGRHALMLAVLSGSIETTQLIGSRFPAEVNREAPGHKNALHIAARQGDTEMVSLLLDLKADASQQDGKGRTPLHFAVLAKSASPEMLIALAKPEAQQKENCEGLRPIDLLVENNCRDNPLESLLEQTPVDLLTSSRFRKFTPLMRATLAGKTSCARLIGKRLKKDLESSELRKQGAKALMVASSIGDIAAIQALYQETDADPLQVDDRGRPVAFYVGTMPFRGGGRGRYSARTTLRALLPVEHDVATKVLEKVDGRGSSLLARWAYDGAFYTVKLLISLGANCNAKLRRTYYGYDTALSVVRNRLLSVGQGNMSLRSEIVMYEGCLSAEFPESGSAYLSGLADIQQLFEDHDCDAGSSKHITPSTSWRPQLEDCFVEF